ncbi:MAG: hypothetical protein HRT57_17565 [Crocinitomicaceae bacterium]|nr:hypothetical protein [Crocinitomicaceae bacterium]
MAKAYYQFELIAVFFLAVAVCYSVAAVWAFKNKAEGFQLGIAIGLTTIVCFIIDIILFGNEVDFMLLGMGVVLTLTGFFGLRELSVKRV